MNYSKELFKVVLAWFALVFAQVVAGMVFPVKVTAPPHILAWLLFSDLLIVAAIAVAAKRSDWRGWKLASALALIPLAITVVDAIEGMVFLKHSGIDWRPLILQNVITYGLVLVFWRFIFGQKELAPVLSSPTQERTFGGRLWRFAVSDFLYLLVYFGAGSIIYPYVRQFYESQVLPAGGTIVALQLLLRGPVFVVVCLFLMRLIRPQGFSGALAIGAVFTIISGVAPLLIPNPYFPDAVRWAHFGEVTSSNFVFATLVALIWKESKPTAAPLEMKQAA
jgi:hypothetical protein